MKKFCPSCGKTIERGTLCAECAGTNIDYKPIKVQLCPSRRFFSKGKWHHFESLESLTAKLIKTFVVQKVKIVQGLEEYPDILAKTGIKKNYDVIVSFEDIEYVIPIYVEVTYSPVVGKFGSSYFEGIMQLRNANQEVKEYIEKYFEKNAERNVFVNNTVDKGDSVDYYFVTKRHIAPLAQKVVRNFGGYFDTNAQLFSRNHLTSKDLFRLNVVVYIAPFNAKDVVIVDEQPILVTRLGKIITGLNLIKGKKFTFSYDEKSKDKIKTLKKQKTNVSKIIPELEILDPEIYQPISAKNPKEFELKLGEKIKVVKYKKDYYVVG